MPTHRELWLGRGFRSVGGTPLYALFLILYFFFLVQGLSLDLRAEYAFFMVIAVITLIVFAAAIAASWQQFKELLFPPGYTLVEAILPAAAWGLSVAAAFEVVVISSGQVSSFTTLSSYDNFQLFVTQVLTVAPTEAFYFRYVLMRTRWGGIPPQILFAVSHPIVRANLLADPLGTLPWILYFFAFGMVFQEMVIAGQAVDVPKRIRRWFGLASEMGAHGSLNLMLILYPKLAVFDIVAKPFNSLARAADVAFGPEQLAVVLLALVVSGLAAWMIQRAADREERRIARLLAPHRLRPPARW